MLKFSAEAIINVTMFLSLFKKRLVKYENKTIILTRIPVYILIVLIVLGSLTKVMAEPDSDMDIFSQSIATVDDISAGIINPAALGLTGIMSLRYIHAFPDSTLKGDDGLMLANRGSFLSVQWLRHTDNKYRIKFLLASGKMLFPKFFWGVSFAYFRGDQFYKNKKIWKLGMLYAPTSQTALAFVIDDLNEPKFGEQRIERKYTFGAALHLNQAKTVVSADSWIREDQRLKKLETTFRLEISPLREITFMTHYITEGAFQVGLVYHFDYIGIGLAGNYHHDDYRGGNFYYNQLPVTSGR